jgi:hypothetical protein
MNRPAHRRQAMVTEETAPPGAGPLAGGRVADAGLADRADLVCSPLEQLRLDRPAALVVNNVSMHECRDIDLGLWTTAAAPFRRALRSPS